MFFIDFDPFLFFLMGFDCFEHDGGRCGWGTVWMGTALNKFDLIGCVFYWAGTAPGGTAWGTAFPNIRTVWSEVSRGDLASFLTKQKCSCKQTLHVDSQLRSIC